MVVPLTLVAVAAAAAAAAAPAAATDVQTADVLVLGAGWAGMSAAHSLALANASFLVLEATNRTGGRTHALAFGPPRRRHLRVTMTARARAHAFRSAGSEQTPLTPPWAQDTRAFPRSYSSAAQTGYPAPGPRAARLAAGRWAT